MAKYVIVGGVAGGASAAARLRRLDENAEIIMFEKGPFVSFSNCSLPYYLGDVVDSSEKLILMTPEKFLKQYNIDARVNQMVISINPATKSARVKNMLDGEQYEISYDKLILSPGAQPLVPPFTGLDSIPHYTLRNVPDAEKIYHFVTLNKPAHITVVGGGFIGLEVAENLIEKGVKVTLIEAADQVMRPFDPEVVRVLEKSLIDHGIELKLNAKVSGFKAKTVILENGDEITTDGVVLAIGVKPDTQWLGDSDIALAKSGHIEVNHNYQTNHKDIYAIGDAISIFNAVSGLNMPLPLAGPANKQGRLVADHIYGRKIRNHGYIGSSAIQVFDYTGAATGVNESYIKHFLPHLQYDVAYIAPSDRVGLMPNASTIMMKIIFEVPTGRVLGAQAVGKGWVEKRIDTLSVAIKAGMTVEDLQDLEFCYAPPYSTGKDPVNHLGYHASNILHGDFKQVPFTQLPQLIESNAQIIDVREPNEFANGHINGAKNIPMSQIRQRLDEIDPSRAVYVHCRTGQRSYNVALMLQAKGFDVYNIAGSFLWISYSFDNSGLLSTPNYR